MSNESYESGLKIRRAVLGDAYVEKSLQSADDFSMAMQRMATTVCWADVWGRDGLPRKTRSMLNLAMLGALGRSHELKVHVRGALNNGVTRDEIKEIFLQMAAYSGVPLGLEAFRAAREVFAELDSDG